MVWSPRSDAIASANVTRHAPVPGRRGGGVPAFQPRLAMQPAVTFRQGGLPSYVTTADLHCQAILADAAQYSFVANAVAPAEHGPSRLVRARHAVGSALVHLGERLKRASAAAPQPLAEREAVG